ncbi:MAG: DEAD/DEAH box helicase [Candidatus Komeilibacteria bacterium]
MELIAQLPKSVKRVTISGTDNLFTKVLLPPSLNNPGVFWLCLANDFTIKRVATLLSWWLHSKQDSQHNSANGNGIIIWPDNQTLSPLQLYYILYTKKIICLTTTTNLRSKIADCETFKQQLLNLHLGDQYNLSDLKKQLINKYGYQLNTQVDQPGLLAVRGFVLDIWSPQQDTPIRIEFDGLKIVSIKAINIIDKSTDQIHQETLIIPQTINFVSRQSLNNLINERHSLLISEEQLEQNKEINNFAWHCLYLQNSLIEEQSKQIYEQPLSWSGNFNLFAKYIREQQANHYQIEIITQNKKAIAALLKEKNLQVNNIVEFKDFTFPGIINHADKIIYLTDYHIFKSAPSEAVQKAKKTFLLEINSKDYVVHRDHGIAQFTGMTLQTINNIEREYFVLEYLAGDKLYLPVEQADKITKYLGVAQPKLHRLGAGSSWPQIIRKLRQDIIKLAQELLNLYARREMTKGTPLLPHQTEENKLAADFPYQETPDQSVALEQTLNDLTKSQPMDRLVCGDVGFGKTEIALRAAWRAALNNKQVVLLCPTTILAQQHYDTFAARFQKYPIKIGLLSRFVANKKQQATIADIAQGKINIIIGTHRLLSKDINYHNIGLIIIDEEQQFGVKDKEKLKDLKTSAHILTLSATPIPRTLNLGLSGLRDISVIATPPAGRLPIKTQIKAFNEELIRKVIRIEIARKGQAYYLYNKVETIEPQLKHLKKLMPEISFAVVHGQLPPKQIAETMHDFDTGKIDVLLCSTIIANGLDLPNVNTLIVDGAQNFGLAQLYQIRGRIGRSNIQAHAYFLYHANKLKGHAKERLLALQQAESLGSGFQIAMRDMEIRGIGNILGKEQHGQASLVGLSLYNELVHQTIAEIKSGIIPTPLIDTTIDLPITIALPKNFLSSEVSRLKYYQLLAGSETEEELDQHFSRLPKPHPQPVKNLKSVLGLKILAQQVGITAINANRQRIKDNFVTKITITFKDELDYTKVKQLLDFNPAWQFKDNELKIDIQKLNKNWLLDLKNTLSFWKK